MHSLATKARQFRWQMTKYVYKYVDRPDIYAKPPPNYRRDIFKKAWELFVDIRLSAKFMVRIIKYMI